MRYHSMVGLRCVIVCWCETCFSSCISSWLQVSPPLVISSDLTHKRSQKHTHIQDGTKDGGNKKMRASRRFTCLRCRYEPISLIRDSPHATLSLFRAMFSPLFFWKGGILTLFTFTVGPIYLGTVIRWRLV